MRRNSSGPCTGGSLPLGKYWRSGPLVFSLVPRSRAQPRRRRRGEVNPLGEQLGQQIVARHLRALVPGERQPCSVRDRGEQVSGRGGERFAGMPGREVYQAHESAAAFHDGADRRAGVAADDCVAFPVADTWVTPARPPGSVPATRRGMRFSPGRAVAFNSATDASVTSGLSRSPAAVNSGNHRSGMTTRYLPHGMPIKAHKCSSSALASSLKPRGRRLRSSTCSAGSGNLGPVTSAAPSSGPSPWWPPPDPKSCRCPSPSLTTTTRPLEATDRQHVAKRRWRVILPAPARCR